MTIIERRNRLRFIQPGRRWLVGAALVFGVTACDGLDGLLAVDLPGEVQESDLNDPRMATTLVVSAQADFECALSPHIWVTGSWVDDLHDTAQDRPGAFFSTRSSNSRFYADHCTGTRPNYAPFQTSRRQAERAVELINEFPEGSVADRDYLLARAYAYAGYSYIFLGEAYCQLTFDAGPVHTREDTWRIAEARFTSALEHATRASAHDSAASIANLALVGRARARLNLGDYDGVVADASQVPKGFEFFATYDETPTRRRNSIYARNVLGSSSSVGTTFVGLEVEGVPDPRVDVYTLGRLGNDGVTPMWHQRKYTSYSSPIRFASWREAQLMIAEARGGSTAVDIINRLRDTFSLPHFESTDPEEIRATVWEERRRELFLEGTRIGDKLRSGEPWPTGHDHRGRAFEDNTCIPLPEFELIANPNL